MPEDKDAKRIRARDPTDLELAAHVFELWRLCGKTSCRRAQHCRGDAAACCEALLEWGEIFRLKAKTYGLREALRRLREPEAPTR